MNRHLAAMELLHEVARGANQARSTDEALAVALCAVGQQRGWDAGDAWRWAAGDDHQLMPADAWYCAPGKDLEALKEACSELRVHPKGGWLRRVLGAREPLLLDDLSRFEDGRREWARSQGIRAVLGVPVVFERNVMAVLEFFHSEPIRSDPSLMQVLTDISIQVAQVSERERLMRLVENRSEQERQRLAQEVHDHLGQQIVAVSIMTANLARRLKRDGSPHAAAAQDIIDALDDAKQQSRALTKSILPVEVDSQGLSLALHDLVDAMEQGYPDVRFEFESQGPTGLENNFVATQLYRIAQEAVYNAISHAHPGHVVVRWDTSSSWLRLEILDDGTGMPDPIPAGSGSGLQIMRHRARLIEARLVIRPRKERGTCVAVEMPLRRPV